MELIRNIPKFDWKFSTSHWNLCEPIARKPWPANHSDINRSRSMTHRRPIFWIKSFPWSATWLSVGDNRQQVLHFARCEHHLSGLIGFYSFDHSTWCSKCVHCITYDRHLLREHVCMIGRFMNIKKNTSKRNVYLRFSMFRLNLDWAKAFDTE